MHRSLASCDAQALGSLIITELQQLDVGPSLLLRIVNSSSLTLAHHHVVILPCATALPHTIVPCCLPSFDYKPVPYMSRIVVLPCIEVHSTVVISR